MAKKVEPTKLVHECNCNHAKSGSGGGAVYGLGLVGSIFYLLPNAGSWQEYILAFLQALVWPAILVYRAFTLIGY